MNLEVSNICAGEHDEADSYLRNREAELFCVDDKSSICSLCAFSERHKGHQIKHFQHINKQRESQIKKFKI